MEQAIKTWNEFFKSMQNEQYCLKLNKFLNEQYRDYICYPPRPLLFNAFKLAPLNTIKVVIIGQDPYHEEGQAMGLSFSVPKGIKLPPSLINIYKEIALEYHCQMDFTNGDLTYLAQQGVLLLNAILSVRKGEPMSHNIEQYKHFLQDVLKTLDQQERPIVFMLWGGAARSLKKIIHNPNHLLLECVHPSPLSANRGGWFNNNHFKTANEYLNKHGLKSINWINR